MPKKDVYSYDFEDWRCFEAEGLRIARPRKDGMPDRE